MKTIASALLASLTIVASIVPTIAAAQTLQGDCDGDGEVRIHELVRCVNIFRDPNRLSSCPACDQNVDGNVTIGEVVGASQCFLNPTVDNDCLFVMSPSTPSATATQTIALPTSTPTATATASATPTGPATVCGNGFLESGEACASCEQDCVIKSCAATATLKTVRVNFSYPDGRTPTSVTVLVGYKSDLVSIPGSSNVTSVRQRVKNLPSNSFPAYNDLDYALRMVVSRGVGVPAGRLFTVDFDTCSGTSAPTPAEFGCTIEGCGSSSGTVSDCACEVVNP